MRILQREEILRIDTPLIHLHGPYEFTNSRERFRLITSLLEFFKNIGQSMGQWPVDQLNVRPVDQLNVNFGHAKQRGNVHVKTIFEKKFEG